MTVIDTEGTVTLAASNKTAALILIDVQEGLDDPRLGRRNNPDAEDNMARLLRHWRQRGQPIFHIQHMSTEPDSPLRPELPGNAIKAVVAPRGAEPLIRKQVNSAFIGTELDTRLRTARIESLVIVGLTTNHCVSTTARMASDLGYNATVVADASAAHEQRSYDGRLHEAETVHQLALANLHEEFATILTTDQVLSLA